MNQVFSFRRFWLLLKLDFAENGKRNVLSFVTIFGLMFVLMNPVIDYSKLDFDPPVLHIMAYCIVTFCTSLFTSLAFEKYASSTQGITAILIPASQTEKFLAALTANLIFATALILLFIGMHFWFMDIIDEKFPEGTNNRKFPATFIFVFTYIFFLVQGVSFLGSIYFRKAVYIKTASVFFAFLLIMTFINRLMIKKLTDNEPDVSGIPFGQWNIYGRSKMFNLGHDESTLVLIKIFLILFVVALWYIAFVRLKEKEI